jgi:sugar phosphate isomerase/epimerase
MYTRRQVLKSVVAMPLLVSSLPGMVRPRLKTSLNAFSFNEPLNKGAITIFEMLDFCAEHEFDAVDITAYYFPDYPKVPEVDFIYTVKNHARKLGLEISGTGVRNDFTLVDKSKRNEHIQLVKNWIGVAQKLGAPVIRIFAGLSVPAGYTWEQTAEWMVKDIKECVAYGKKHGVVVAVQNHNDFIRTPEHVHYLMKAVNDPWFGLIMDTGGYRQGDPYQDTLDTISYAVNWQIKEKIFVNGIEMDTDIDRLIKIIKNSNYTGYLPIETLGVGDPKPKIIALIAKVQAALENYTDVNK